MSAPFVGQRFCELSQRPLRCCIRWYSDSTLVAHEGTIIDNFASFEGDHVLTCCLAEKPRRFEVNVNNLGLKDQLGLVFDFMERYSLRPTLLQGNRQQVHGAESQRSSLEYESLAAC